MFLILLFISVFAQEKDSIKVKKRELEQLRKEILLLEDELKSKTKKERESLEFLEKSNRQILLIQKLINNIKLEEEKKIKEIDFIEGEIAKIENRISLLKEKYSRYVVWIYKNRNYSFMKYLLNSNSFSQLLKRFRYLNFISEQNEKDLKLLTESKNNLAKYRNQLQKEKEEKELLVTQKLKEQKLLEEKQSEKKSLIASLRYDKKMLAAEIDSKRKAEIEIKTLIANLVEKERLNKSIALEAKSKEKSYKPVFDYNKLTNFDLLKGKLNWPVKSGKIVRKFGENKNVKLNTITINYGIDILTREGELVYAVSDGIVSAVEWIPGFGSVVILTHANQYRTVYGHITDINVKEGDLVKANTVIGKVNESLEGNILHFEIWNERNYQNPEVWLTKR
ncbi:MAG: peptidoglycan DD-metalloendopeptidase family protein [Melioribacter sp.]|nr:peptidoglycan DD-metalloendopeptidase family protein [Melioribacter sp.]